MVSRILSVRSEIEADSTHLSQSGDERRRWPRKPHLDRVVCYPDVENHFQCALENFTAEVVDVGPEGVGIRTDHPIPPGQTICFKGNTAAWEGVVRWSLVFGNSYRAGVQFV